MRRVQPNARMNDIGVHSVRASHRSFKEVQSMAGCCELARKSRGR
jgi:hypothetical protein